MKAESFSLTKLLLANADFEIPFFQRPYVWDKDNWETLLENLLDDNRTHFLGSIVLKPIPTTAGHNQKFCVIDGQQRLTTYSILIKACYDLVPDAGKYDSNFLKTIFVDGTYLEGEKAVPKLVHSVFDRDNYNNILKGKSCESDDNRLSECYQYFSHDLKTRGLDEIRRLWTFLKRDDLNTIVKIDLEDKDSEQEIFDTINSTGVKLTSADIIKNALFQRANELLGADGESKVVDLYNKEWTSEFYSDQDTNNYWNELLAGQKFARTNLEMLLFCFASIKGFFKVEEHKVVELADIFKRKISGFSNFNDLKSFIAEIRAYASYYRTIFRNRDKDTVYSYTDGLERLMQILSEVNVVSFNPYILKLVYQAQETDFNKLPDDVKNELYDLETLIIRGIVTRLNAKKNYNKFCGELLKDAYKVAHISNMPDYSLDDQSVKDWLKQMSSNGIATLILFWIELYLNRDAKNAHKELKYIYSLEHIMPRKWEAHWKSVPVRDMDGALVKDAIHARTIRDKAVSQLGNMTLLTSKLNTSIHHAGFKTKIANIKKYSNLKITTELFDSSKWDEASIEKRTTKLWKDFISVWHLRNETKPSGQRGTPIPNSHSPNYPVKNLFVYVLMPILQSGKFSDSEIESFTTQTGSSKFHIGGYALLKKFNGDIKIRYDAKGVARFYKDVYVINGRQYLLTSQIYKVYKEHYLKLLEELGIQREDAERIARNPTARPTSEQSKQGWLFS